MNRTDLEKIDCSTRVDYRSGTLKPAAGRHGAPAFSEPLSVADQAEPRRALCQPHAELRAGYTGCVLGALLRVGV